MKESENTYVAKLLDLMLDIDRGISIYSKTFKDYGAKDANQITLDELLVSQTKTKPFILECHVSLTF